MGSREERRVVRKGPAGIAVREGGPGKGQEPVGTSEGQKVLDLEKRANQDREALRSAWV